MASLRGLDAGFAALAAALVVVALGLAAAGDLVLPAVPLLFGLAGIAGAALVLLFSVWRQGRQVHAMAEAELEGLRRKEEEKLSRILDGLPGAVYLGELYPDGSMRLDSVSQGHEGLRELGLGHGQGTAQGWWERLDPETQEALRDFGRRLMEHGQAMVEYAVRREDGAQVWLRDTARVTGLAADGYAGVVGMVVDCTAERQIADRALHASKLATMGRIATSIAHEMIQPISTILLAGETAMNGLPDAEGLDPTRKRIGRIVEQAKRARDFMDHLRIFGRADTGALDPVFLPDALDGALRIAMPALTEGRVEFVRQIDPDLPPLRARRVLLEQLLLNLILNARDAMENQPAETRRLRVTAVPDGDTRAMVVIEDSGPGMPEAVLRHAFEPFFTTKPAGKGTGLGLAICASIAEGFGGSIAAANSSLGLRITLLLPLWSEDAAVDSVPDGGVE
jgi:C4-dicarboxylate-specific signal transduction histidine kinase